MTKIPNQIHWMEENAKYSFNSISRNITIQNMTREI